MIRCREIRTTDLEAVADLLAQGFTGRTRNYWMDGLKRQAQRAVPEGYPRFGYLLDHDEVPVGIVLSIYTVRDCGGSSAICCNLSSHYVKPAFRNYAPLLAKVAHRHKNVTYLNISPARWTWQALEAQGFRVYCGGLFFSFPVLSRRGKNMTIEVVKQDARAVDGLSAAHVALLARHAEYGCLSLACRAADGRTFPFVLQAMRVYEIQLPVMQMIYCADLADYQACAGAIGRYLLRRGRVSVALDANGRLGDLAGIYREPIGRKYFRGPSSPRLADLSDTELVIFGP